MYPNINSLELYITRHGWDILQTLHISLSIQGAFYPDLRFIQSMDVNQGRGNIIMSQLFLNGHYGLF